MHHGSIARTETYGKYPRFWGWMYVSTSCLVDYLRDPGFHKRYRHIQPIPTIYTKLWLNLIRAIGIVGRLVALLIPCTQHCSSIAPGLPSPQTRETSALPTETNHVHHPEGAKNASIITHVRASMPKAAPVLPLNCSWQQIERFSSDFDPFLVKWNSISVQLIQPRFQVTNDV